MAEFDRGQTFLDKKATNLEGTKGKYFIALSNANDGDEEIICFVMNTEHRMDIHQLNCNKIKNKYIIEPNKLNFITHHTSIMLKKENYYTLDELCGDNIEFFEVANDTLQREIRKCIDNGYLLDKGIKLIKDSFKS